ncbi:MAG: cytochrome C oxidase subunit IV [Spirochaetia bacterium]|nr:cytochrome C oxidase subunit IV [Spirochaetia bacterium]
MELVVQYSLYIISMVCIFVPFFGFGMAPPTVITAAVGVFAGNAYSLIVQQGIIKNFIKDNKDGGKSSPLIPVLEEAQKAIDAIENPGLAMKNDHHGEGHNEHGEHHIIPISVYVGVLLILLLGTVITVAVAQVDFGAMNTVIAMLVATIKAGFVLAFFMHLKYDNLLNRVIFGSGFFFLMLLIAFSAADIFTRASVVKSF